MSKICLKKALQLLARRNHSCDELCKKLEVRGFTKLQVNSTIDECMRLGYLDDQCFADTYSKQLHRKGYGINGLKSKLTAKGISGKIIHSSIAHYNKDEVQLKACKKVLNKKIKHLEGNELPIHMRQKIQRFLFYRGFPSHIIGQAVDDHGGSKDEM